MIHWIKSVYRYLLARILPKPTDTSVIPPGIYCYSKTKKLYKNDGMPYHKLLDLCPYLIRNPFRRYQSNGYCRFINAGDWQRDGTGILWDQCKECGGNDD